MTIPTAPVVEATPAAPAAFVAPVEVIDDFSSAFDALNEPAPAIAPVVATPPEDPAPADPAVVPAAAEVAPVVPAEPVAAAPAAPAEPAVVPAPVVQVPVAPVVAPAEPAPVAAPVYTADEQARVEAYRKDWPDIHAGEALIRRAEYQELVSYVFAQVQSVLAPMQEFVGRQSTRTQYDDLIDLVPDYDAVRDQTLDWIGKQPEYLKNAYQHVANSGSPADVADLIARFKKETGYAAPAAAASAIPVPAAPVAPVAAPLNPAAAAAVSGLRVVQSSRSTQSAPVDANNFDAAFEEFAKAK